MSTRNFEAWLSTFRKSISDYSYYVDFKKVISNVDKIRVELHMLDSLIGVKNVEERFEELITKYPNVLKCIPILLAVRASEIFVFDNGKELNYSFKKLNYSIEQYKIFMKKTGLFELLSNHLIQSVYDYVTGVETGLDSNGRKNRGGHLMENLVENYIQKAGFVKNSTYFKEMYRSEIEKKWDIDLSAISNQGKNEKRFDYVVKTNNMIYAIEVNFYTGSGSKLNETARSYKTITEEVATINGLTFVWFTDGAGWTSAKGNLEETFDVLETIYNISDMENGIMKQIFK